MEERIKLIQGDITTAGVLLVQNAGGKVSDFSGETNHIFGKEIIATNNYIHNEFQNLFTKWKNG